jgi:plasmid stability protein
MWWMKQNLTIQLDDETIRDAKVLAARRGTSVSALIARQITKMTAAEQRYQEAKARALAAMDNAVDRGERNWTREDLYDR